MMILILEETQVIINLPEVPLHKTANETPSRVSVETVCLLKTFFKVNW